MTSRASLLHRIHRRYQTVAEPLEVGALRLNFTRIADPDRVLDEVAIEADRREKVTGQSSSEESLHLPYWAELWDSAMGMAQYLERFWRIGAGGSALNILDLGCGMGLAGAAAAALGHHVLFGDLEAPALLFAQLNSLDFASRVRTRRLNWQRCQLGERFDLILGSDILYERGQWPHLAAFWDNHLTSEGTILLGEPGRQTGELFGPWLRDYPWILSEREEAVASRARPIRIFELRRRPIAQVDTTGLGAYQ
jgi:predicted nicotinamide N-methyase